MPRATAGVHKMRVASGDQVHILAHRLPFVAWRGHRFNEGKRLKLLQRLEAQELHNHVYRAEACFHTGLTGLLSIYDNSGREYSAHHTDLVRI